MLEEKTIISEPNLSNPVERLQMLIELNRWVANGFMSLETVSSLLKGLRKRD